MRPRSLREVAERVREGDLFDLSLRNFLDEFAAVPSGAALAAEPPCLRDLSAQGRLFDAYLAATAEFLAAEHNLPLAPWVWAPERQLRRPWFSLPWAGMRAVLLLESPAPFRSRNLFVSANALSRA
jgi:hypothetical protein